MYETQAKEELIRLFDLDTGYNNLADRKFVSFENLESFKATKDALRASGWVLLQHSIHFHNLFKKRPKCQFFRIAIRYSITCQ